MKTYKGKVQHINRSGDGCYVTIMAFESDVRTVTFVVEGEPLIAKVEKLTLTQTDCNFTIDGNRLVGVVPA
jgi:hypothetical protein